MKVHVLEGYGHSARDGRREQYCYRLEGHASFGLGFEVRTHLSWAVTLLVLPPMMRDKMQGTKGRVSGGVWNAKRIEDARPWCRPSWTTMAPPTVVSRARNGMRVDG